MASTFDFDNQRETPTRSGRKPPHSRKSRWPLAVGLVVLGLLVAGGAFVAVRMGSDKKADKDYMAFLALSYEAYAVHCYKYFWLSEAEKFANFGNHEGRIERGTAATQARLLASDLCDDPINAYESRKLENRRLFVERHRIDTDGHRDAFKSRHPERDLIFKKIDELTVNRARLRMLPLMAKLNDEHIRLVRAAQPLTREKNEEIDVEFDKFRQALVRKEVASMLEELREMVRTMPAIKKLTDDLR